VNLTGRTTFMTLMNARTGDIGYEGFSGELNKATQINAGLMFIHKNGT